MGEEEVKHKYPSSKNCQKFNNFLFCCDSSECGKNYLLFVLYFFQFFPQKIIDSIISTWLRGTSQGGGGCGAGGALGGRVAAGLSPQMRPDSQPLCHLDVVRWVYVVEHAAAGQLHLKRNTYADQKQKLRAQIPNT